MPHLPAGHVAEQGRRPEQLGGDRDVAIAAAAARSTIAARLDPQRRRAQRQPPVDPPVGEQAVAVDQDPRRGQPLQLAAQEGRRRRPAVAAGSGPASMLSRRSAVRRPEMSSRALPGPARPAAVAADVEPDRAAGAEHRADDAVRRRLGSGRRDRSGRGPARRRAEAAAGRRRRGRRCRARSAPGRCGSRPGRAGCRPARARSSAAPIRSCRTSSRPRWMS